MITLNNGVQMPQIGFGTFQITDPSYISMAIESGYRLIDTATMYGNETMIGSIIHSLDRSTLFLTTKIWIQDYNCIDQAIQKSMERLGTDYLDLVLLHEPYGHWQKAWLNLEEAYEKGMVRAIGVSNFHQAKMDELLSFAHIVPQVNQIEIHPFFTETPFIQSLKQNQIQPEAWGPLCEGQKGIFEHPILHLIGQKYQKSVAQVVLRWSIQHGNIVIPSSTKREHILENRAIFDFELTPEDMQTIDALDLGHSEIIDFDSASTERLLMRCRIPD
jgi:2,5-diketo-D-gluconate reductase A